MKAEPSRLIIRKFIKKTGVIKRLSTLSPYKELIECDFIAMGAIFYPVKCDAHKTAQHFSFI